VSAAMKLPSWRQRGVELRGRSVPLPTQRRAHSDWLITRISQVEILREPEAADKSGDRSKGQRLPGNQTSEAGRLNVVLKLDLFLEV
jgi:hypothetical protein